MLDIINEKTLSEAAWNELASRAELPCSWQDYKAAAGSMQTIPEDARKYCRIALRSIAILIINDELHAAYSKDVSKIGMGFYSPVHLLPQTCARIWVPGRSLLRLRVKRCRRLGERSFECGGVFEAVAQR